MRILVIEDDVSKADAVEAQITSCFRGSNTAVLTRVGSMSDAARTLAQRDYDLVILDLMLPYIPNTPSSSSAGLELLNHIREPNGRNREAVVLALSAFPDEVSNSRHQFESAGVLIITYAEDGAWRSSLGEVLEDLRRRLAKRIPVDFVVVCALEEEREAFSLHCAVSSREIVAGLNVQFVEYSGGAMAPLKGALVRLSRMGLVAATLETAIANQVFLSDVFGMSGICAGFSANAELGQLIVASPAWEYQAGKWSKNGFEIAPLQVDLKSSTRSIVDHELGLGSFSETIEDGLPRDCRRPALRASAKLAPFATGSAVIADTSRLTHISNQHRKVAGLDMETYGFYYSLENATSPPQHFFALKSVVDLADRAKNDDFHVFGCCVSAKASLALVQSLCAAVMASSRLD